MIRDVRQYWKAVRAAEAALPPFVWLTGAGAEFAFAVEVPAAIAARLLHDKKHRLATEAEVAAHLAREAEIARQARDASRKRAGTVLVGVGAGEAPAGLVSSKPGRKTRR